MKTITRIVSVAACIAVYATCSIIEWLQNRSRLVNLDPIIIPIAILVVCVVALVIGSSK